MEKLKTTYNTEKALFVKAGEMDGLDVSGYSEAPLRVGVLNAALRDYVGITPVNTLKGVIPVVGYDNTKMLTNFKETGKIEIVELDNLNSAEFNISNGSGSGNYGIIVDVDADVHDDSKEIIEGYMSVEHDNRLVNTENSVICALLLADKVPVPMAPENVGVKVNDSLNAKAKKVTFIITNNSGFAKLDVKDINGNSFIKKTRDGRFIYDDKYEVIEIDNPILGNLPEGAPVIIGDIAGACTLLRAADTKNKVEDDCSIYRSRYIDAEGAVKLTNSDKCYIVGYLA